MSREDGFSKQMHSKHAAILRSHDLIFHKILNATKKRNQQVQRVIVLSMSCARLYKYGPTCLCSILFLFRSILFYSVLVYSASPCGQMNVLPMNSRASTPRNAEVGREARTQTEAILSIALRTVKHCPPWASHQLAAS